MVAEAAKAASLSTAHLHGSLGWSADLVGIGVISSAHATWRHPAAVTAIRAGYLSTKRMPAPAKPMAGTGAGDAPGSQRASRRLVAHATAVNVIPPQPVMRTASTDGRPPLSRQARYGQSGPRAVAGNSTEYGGDRHAITANKCCRRRYNPAVASE